METVVSCPWIGQLHDPLDPSSALVGPVATDAGAGAEGELDSSDSSSLNAERIAAKASFGVA